MPRKHFNKFRGSAKGIGEEVRIAVNLAISNFLATDDNTELELQSSLSAEERAYVHQLAKELGLRSKSRGKASNRFLTVYKREGSSIVQADPSFRLGPATRQAVSEVLRRFPLSGKERLELQPPTERDRIDPGDGCARDQRKNLGRLNNGIAQVPTSATNPALLPFREALPIWPMRDEIVETIVNSQVTVISGQTGSGKTTQVPQFLVEHYAACGRPCRVICTQPRRISAVSVSERVAAERNEPVGQSVGYQIRLESRVSPRTILTYCTDGVLLRTLMGGDSSLGSVTHIIVDEVHERNRFSDFLLISLKDALAKFRNLRLTLMSATVDTSVFTKYFNNCPVITVPGRQFDVEEYFLEDVLKRTGYMALSKLPLEGRSKHVRRAELDKWSRYVPGTTEPPGVSSPTARLQADQPNQLDSHRMDEHISVAWMEGSDAAFRDLLDFLAHGTVSVDHQHSISSVTALMAAACRGNLPVVLELLNLGGSVGVRASNDMTALDWASKQEHRHVVAALELYMSETGVSEGLDVCEEEGQLRDEDKELLDLYHRSVSDENIDLDLVMSLLTEIHSTTDTSGAILIFIAGYEDIVSLRDRIQGDEGFVNYALYTLHSNMQTSDQKKVFRPSLRGQRKIIIATNIAETSITIDDVVYVIDCGKVKEKSFDCMSGVCMLRATWISQACAKQRRGRAGRTRPGVCFHMFSSARFASMQPFHTPEILRLPLHELCLHTKLLAPAHTPIADFLGRAIEPPSFMVTRNAVTLLKRMDALDAWEDLTELGRHLLDLPVEPRLGKILLYSIVLKCLDPVLTIVCCLAYKDPFLLPTQAFQRRASQQSRQALGGGAFSDHLALLRVFQGWQQARAGGSERSFCDKHFASHSTLEMIQGTRTQILAQLRASGLVAVRNEMRELNLNADNWAAVKAALCAGMYPNLIRVDREHSQLRTEKESRVMFHPSSTLRDTLKLSHGSANASNKATVESLPSDWLIYEELSRSGRFCHARCCTLVSPVTVALFAGPSKMSPAAVAESDVVVDGDSDSEAEEVPLSDRASVKVDDWVVFRVDAEAARLGLQLRQKWNALFLRRMRAPDKPWTQGDEAVLGAVIRVLTLEERDLGLLQPPGVGQRPRMTANDSFQGASRSRADANNRVNTRRCSEASHVAQGHAGQGHAGQGHAGQGHMSQSKPQRRDNREYLPYGDERSLLPDGARSLPDGGASSFFVIKASSSKCIDLSLASSLWAFNPKTERLLLARHRSGERVILIFSVQGSGHFQGYAQLSGNRPPGAPKGHNGSAPIAIEWLKRANIPFQATQHLLNSYNDNQRVQTSRDGQQIETSVGEQLCTMWSKFPPPPLHGRLAPEARSRGYQPRGQYK